MREPLWRAWLRCWRPVMFWAGGTAFGLLAAAQVGWLWAGIAALQLGHLGAVVSTARDRWWVVLQMRAGAHGRKG